MDILPLGAGASTHDGTDGPYYVSLGDSLATGVQPTGREDFQFRTDEGYADQLGALGRLVIPGLRTVKLGYPGESTTTMIRGGLASYPHGSQLDEAIWFLREHRGSVAFVTIDIGFNDLPSYTLEAVPVGMATTAANLPGILERLREAAGSGVPIVGTTIYDPFLFLWLMGPEGQAQARMSVWDAVVPINDHLRGLYAAAGLKVADVEGAFETLDFETPAQLEGVGTVPVNVARACQWTWAAAAPPLGPDFHANVHGYRAIAGSFARILLPQV